jgi:hypothetical protein
MEKISEKKTNRGRFKAYLTSLVEYKKWKKFHMAEVFFETKTLKTLIYCSLCFRHQIGHCLLKNIFMKLLICTFCLLLTAFVGNTQLSEDEKAVLEQSHDKEFYSERTNITLEKEERYVIIVENSIAHLNEVLQHIHLLFHASKDKAQAKEILTNYAVKLNYLIPEFPTASILEFDTHGLHKWLLENKNQSELIPTILELFGVVESDLHHLNNT